ncbi:MAG: Gfo/Idh/MocA family oxidoreductase [Gammaproteobacteria bacterium]|nr:Gfo/Idh/MocA family oxidoreductase [Gammaproteobacteria bacterium]MDE0366301.1 Gfo/Idh/MocA family oxidoreductase [Gammaproteobacteria bacterium]
MKLALIGTGVMGKAHAIALRSVATVFPDVPAPVREILADVDSSRAEQRAAAWGFRHATDDWHSACLAPEVDVVDICTPNHLHRKMALAAIAAGKHVYCEKPLGLDGAEAASLVLAAREAGVKTAVGFNYACNPMMRLARSILRSGELGEPVNFRGSFQEDYLSDPRAPFGWRCARSTAGSGALSDLGSHLIHLAHFLVGRLERVYGNLTTVYGQRPDPNGSGWREVENEDMAQVLLRFESGMPGTLEISRVATGRKCGLSFSLTASRGSLEFDQERMNELRVYRTADRSGQAGFQTILAGPEHADYGNLCPAPGHGLGVNDLKVIELRNVLAGIAHGRAIETDFEAGWRVQAVIDAIEESDRNRCWTSPAPTPLSPVPATGDGQKTANRSGGQ